MLTTLTVEQVQAIVANAVSSRGGRIVASSPGLLSATFGKRFSWLWFFLLAGVFYLLWWAVAKKDDTLTVSTMPEGPYVRVSLTSNGGRAHKARAAVAQSVMPYSVR